MTLDTATSVACAQVRSGNGRIDVPIALPGMRGVLHSRPSDGGRGGDVYSISVCGSGLLTRICLADLVGHGAGVAALGSRMHTLLQRFVNRRDHTRILDELNAALLEVGLDAMTTAAMFTYYPPSRRLSFSYAGHPPGWFYRQRDRRWTRLVANPEPEIDGASDTDLVDGVLGVSASASFTRSTITTTPRDRLLLLTDGVLEAPSPLGSQFGTERLEDVLARHGDDTPTLLAERVLEALSTHRNSTALDHDDVTITVLEFVDGPRGPALWHVVRNRVLAPLRLVGSR